MKVSNKKKTMFTVQNLMKIFLAVLFATAALALCTADVEAKKGTRVDVGAQANLTSGPSLRMLVYYVNPSDSPIFIKGIEIFEPNGDLASSDFSTTEFATLPVELGPFESKGFLLGAVGIVHVNSPPPVLFQVHTYWDAKQATVGLKSWSATIVFNSFGFVARSSQEGFDLTGRGYGGD